VHCRDTIPLPRGRRGRGRIVCGLRTTSAINAFRVMVKIVVNVVDEENGGRGCLMSNVTFDNISVISWSVSLNIRYISN
jgi:hypothetical protein